MRIHHAAALFILLLTAGAPGRAQEYVLLGWNDLGMHCANKDFSKVVVLPPYNNVRAQLLLKQSGQMPLLLRDGYTISYSIPGNTYSVGKTDFWTYAQQLFGLADPLPPNIGLTGKGLAGTMDTTGEGFIATGIPITPFSDDDLVHEKPYQLIRLVARATGDTAVLATTEVVIPVSNEIGCVQSGCHGSETGILNAHETVPGFNRSGPVLCASCHASNALGTPGNPEARSLSFRIHDRHQNISPAGAITTCYKCHPGPNTQCLRDVMRTSPSQMVCQDCHGTMSVVASTITAGRRPWLDEPSCGDPACHGAAHAEEPGLLFRESRGHGGLFCSACHGSPHAITPTSQPNDNLQSIRLQGVAGALRECTVCHADPPAAGGPHGLTYSTTVTAQIPVTPTWNLLSVPVSVPDRSTAELFPAAVSPAYGRSHTGGYVQRDTLEYGEGYWLKFAAAAIVAMTGSRRTRDTIAVVEGWNLIGSVTFPVSASAVQELPPGTIMSGFYTFSPSGYEESPLISPGGAYWVKCSGPGMLILSSTGVARPPEAR